MRTLKDRGPSRGRRMDNRDEWRERGHTGNVPYSRQSIYFIEVSGETNETRKIVIE